MHVVHGHFHRNAPTLADQRGRWDERVMAAITRRVGTLACAIIFALLSISSAPAKFAEGVKGTVEWTAQTFLQLVLLSIILGGQRVSEKANDAQTAHISAGVDTIISLVQAPGEPRDADPHDASDRPPGAPSRGRS